MYKKNRNFSCTFWIIQIYFSDSGKFLCIYAYFGASIHLILFLVSNHGKQETWLTKPKKVRNLQKAFSLRTIKVWRFEIIDGVKYVYCIQHAYKFLLREQVGYAVVLWRLRQCVSCLYIICFMLFVRCFHPSRESFTYMSEYVTITASSYVKV